jgi:hypothetical protein
VIAEAVYREVFADGKPPVHALLRDYARGTIAHAQHNGADLAGIDIAKTEPPYESPWPIAAASEKQLEKKYRQDVWLGIWSSVMSWGDFHRYEVDPAIRQFLAPNQKERKRKAKQDARKRADDAWKTFRKSLTTHQKKLISRKNVDWDAFAGALSPKQAGEFLRVSPMFEPSRSYDRPISFDPKLASRWIMARVAKLGWTPERFGDFDRFMNYQSPSRSSHKAERIGKKYQWIALNELVARISDHCPMETTWGGAAQEYEGPWQVGLRDIDPSLLLASTRASSWEPTPASWWCPLEVSFPEEMAPAARDQWLRDGMDLPDPASLIAVTDGEATDWLALDGYYNWSQKIPPEEKPFEVDQCNLWYILKSYLIRKTDLAKFSRWAKTQDWTGRWMPEAPTIHSVFLGEYPWHPSGLESSVAWTTDASLGSKALAVPILATSADYMWEGNVLDCSLSSAVTGSVPSSEFHNLIGLSWSGRDFEYASRTGEIVAFDPSARSAGASVHLMKHSFLSEFLRDGEYAIVFTILGEKIVHGPLVQELDRLYVSATYSFDSKSLKRINLTTTVNESWSKAAEAKGALPKRK